MGFFLQKIYKKLLIKKPEVFSFYEEFKKINKAFCLNHKMITKIYLLRLLTTKKNIYNVKNPKKTIKPDKDYLLKENSFDIEEIQEGINKKYNDVNNPEESIKKLQNYDLISFDIFDTCIFRPFEKPSDLFYYISSKLNIENFYSLRVKAETIARAKTNKKNNEIVIQDIYNELPSKVKDKINFHVEIDFEKELCYANKYMLSIFNALKKNGKKLIAISDMYLPKAVIEEILNKNGFIGFDEIFVSNDFMESKSNGGLFKIAKKNYKSLKSFIHIGDNISADINGARKGGFESFYYKKNINKNFS